MSTALPPIPWEVLMRRREELLDRGQDPLDDLLEQQAHDDARHDRQRDHHPAGSAP